MSYPHEFGTSCDFASGLSPNAEEYSSSPVREKRCRSCHRTAEQKLPVKLQIPSFPPKNSREKLSDHEKSSYCKAQCFSSAKAD